MLFDVGRNAKYGPGFQLAASGTWTMEFSSNGKEMEIAIYYSGFKVWGLRDLVSRLIRGLIWVSIWLVGVINVLTKSP